MLLPTTLLLLTVDQLKTVDVPDGPPVLAAVVYTGERGDDGELGDHDPTICDTDEDELEPCEVEALVRRAAERGADLVVVSEAAFEEALPEPQPIVGRRPPLHGAPLQRRFGELAEELGLYLVIQLELTDGDFLFSGQVAFDPNGIVVGRHHKFELYDGEADTYEPGTDVSVFDTPFGKVGLLICSDIYGDPQLHERLAHTLRPKTIALSSIWTVEDATRWQAAFAHDWEVTVVAANGAAGDGRGAGIYDRRGRALVLTHEGRDAVLTASP